ncbi:phage virion morphogenesis protein [Actinomadura montaniterrae]|uniref:HK97 gp10 family phage protein n=1 Tax=Actinomadura montaniterrae TaxID=1803903 RepID=A0A6L3W0J3_9ACTN|nr:hypothetical protein [Actinomadura montaniterrae]KAB2384759.1 hypothetical protein F9B16_09940 [Actinomadura montaniterrae]
MSPSGDRLRRMAELAAHDGGRAAAGAMAREGRNAIREALNRRSHRRGTPTPAAPGQPPARISGALMTHIVVVPAVNEGSYRWVATAGSDGILPYDRIQNLGGVAGRGHRTTLPPRPYIVPPVRDLRASGRLSEVGAEAFRAVVHGR